MVDLTKPIEVRMADLEGAFTRTRDYVIDNIENLMLKHNGLVSSIHNLTMQNQQQLLQINKLESRITELENTVREIITKR